MGSIVGSKSGKSWVENPGDITEWVEVDGAAELLSRFRKLLESRGVAG